MRLSTHLKSGLRLGSSVAALCGAFAGSALAASPSPAEQIASVGYKARYLVSPPYSQIVPDSGVHRKGHARTNYRLLVLPAGAAPPKVTANAASPLTATPPAPTYLVNTPGSLACIYGLVSANGTHCNPNTAGQVSNLGSKAIAIVDAFDYPAALSDANLYSAQFGLPPLTNSTFVQTWVGTSAPPLDTTGWSVEAALDIQMAHAMAPAAKIIFVEAQSDSNDDLFAAVDLATKLVAAAGGGQVSMSWGTDEDQSQTVYESHFTPPNPPNYVNYYAAAGDSGDTFFPDLLGLASTDTAHTPALYPATSPQVIAVGGTSTSFDYRTGDFLRQTSWADAGAGPSLVFSRPAFQNSVANVVGNRRGVPDLSAVANPDTGVWIVQTDPTLGFILGPLWYTVGGTSVASPLVAGIANAAKAFNPTTVSTLTQIYAKASAFKDVTVGYCGPYAVWTAGVGYDFCTGVGTPGLQTP